MYKNYVRIMMMFCTNQNFQSTNRIVRWWISTNKKNFAEKSPKEKLLPNIFGQVDLKYFSGRLCCSKAHRFLLGVFVSLSDTKKRKSLKVWNGTISAELLLSCYLPAHCHSLSYINNKQDTMTPWHHDTMLMLIRKYFLSQRDN